MNMKKTARIVYIALAAIVLISFAYFAISGGLGKKRLHYRPGPYTDAQLGEIYNEVESGAQSLEDLERICDVRYVDAVAAKKTAVVTGENQALVIWYDEAGFAESRKMLSMSPSSEVFEALPADASIRNVMDVDPQADYSFLYSGRNDTPRHTYHITSDGYLVEITFDSNYDIIKVLKNPLESKKE